MVIKVNTKKINYRLEFNGKYALIIGDSATGKTTFHKAITTAASGHSGSTKVECEHSVIALASNADEILLEAYHDVVFVMDENCKLLHLKNIGTLLKNSDNYFVIISRKKFDWLPVSVDNVFKIKQSGQNYHFVPMVPRYNIREY